MRFDPESLVDMGSAGAYCGTITSVNKRKRFNMNIDFLQIIRDNWIAFTLGVTFTLISAAVQTAKGVIDFHEEISVTRYLNKLKSLLEHTNANSFVCQHINTLRENETFRIASGIDVYPEKAKLLMEIYLDGVASKNELKRLSPYLMPKNNLVSITVTKLDKFAFLYSAISKTILLTLGFCIGLLNCLTNNCSQAIAGLIFMCILTVIGILLGKEYNTLRILRRVRERLIELDKVTNPADSIEWNPVLW